MSLKHCLLPSGQLVILYRIYSYLYKFKITRFIAYILYYFARIIFSSDIHPACKIGKRFNICHHFGIVIGKNVVIGNNVIVYNGVSIGQRNIHNSKMPTIDDNAILYKGAVVIGDIKLEPGTIVGANMVLCRGRKE